MNKAYKSRLAALIGLVLLAGVLAACGGRSASGPAAGGTSGQVASEPAARSAMGAAPPMAPAPTPGSAAKTMAADAAVAQSMPQPGTAGESGGSAGLGGPLGFGPNLDTAFSRKIIMNADIRLRVENLRDAVGEIQSLANMNRGYVADSRVSGSDDDGWNAQIVLRIPSTHFGEIYSNLRKLGKVQEERQWSNDVTEQYMDLEARIRILSEYEQRLRDLALKADRFEDWLRLTTQINQTRIEIEQLTGRLRLLQNQVEFSTINISLYQPRAGTVVEPEAAGLGTRMIQAFKESAQAVLEFGEAMFIFLAGLVPVLAFLAIMVTILWWPVRTATRRLRASRSTLPADQQGPPVG